MKIGYDGKRALTNMTGLGNYSRLIIESMAGEFPTDDIVVYSPRRHDNPRIRSWKQHGNISMRFPLSGETPFGKSVWRTFGITSSLQKENVDIYHGLSNELPLNIRKSGVATVVTIHDVIYRTLPYCYKFADRKIYDFKYGASCRNASHVIAISECTKRDVMRFYKVPEERIDVIYQGCHNSFTPIIDRTVAQSDTNALRELQIPERYLIQVGTIERRKNALISIRALAGLSDKKISLILVGRATPYLDEILKEAHRLNIEHRVLVCSDIPFSLLPTLVRNAAAALYPSRYEGFGLPVLEALSCGTPTVAATGSCLEEAGGDAAIYVDPDDTTAAVKAIDAILDDNNLRAEMKHKGLKHASRFSNDRVATETHRVYEKLLRKK